MAQHQWLRDRALNRLNLYLNDPAGGTVMIPTANLWMRYESMHARAFHKCPADFLKLRAEREETRTGFVLEERATESHTFKIEYRELRNRELKSREPAGGTPRTDKILEAQMQKAA